MIKCAYCGKELNVVPTTSGYHVDSKYWKGDGPERQYFCDAKCSLEQHEKERKIIESLGGKDG